MDLQELINRARFLFADAPERLRVFDLVNGRRNAKDMAKMVRRHVNNVHRDLRVLHDGGLIQPKAANDGSPLRRNGFLLYEKVPLARTIGSSYFMGPFRSLATPRQKPATTLSLEKGKKMKVQPLTVPSENELLDIARDGEDQTYEFKGQGTEINKISREIAAMLHARQGGIIIYGIDDSGTIQGANVSRQKFDQSLHNSIRNTISPAASVKLQSLRVMGTEVLVIVVPPWNRKDVFQFDGRVLLRKGTNVFYARPEEMRKLHKGEYVI